MPSAEALGDRRGAFRLLTIRWNETSLNMDDPEPLLDEIREQIRVLDENTPTAANTRKR